MSYISDELNNKQDQLIKINTKLRDNSSKLSNKNIISSNFVDSYREKIKYLENDISNFKSLLKTAYDAAAMLERANQMNADIASYNSNISKYKNDIKYYEKKATENNTYANEINNLKNKIEQCNNKLAYSRKEYDYLIKKVKNMVSDY